MYDPYNGQDTSVALQNTFIVFIRTKAERVPGLRFDQNWATGLWINIQPIEAIVRPNANGHLRFVAHDQERIGRIGPRRIQERRRAP